MYVANFFERLLKKFVSFPTIEDYHDIEDTVFVEFDCSGRTVGDETAANTDREHHHHLFCFVNVAAV